MGDQDYSSDAGLKRPPPPDEYSSYGGGQEGNYDQAAGENFPDQESSGYNYDPTVQADSGYTYDPNAATTGSAPYDPNANTGNQYKPKANSGGSSYTQSGEQEPQKNQQQSQGAGGGYNQGGGYNNQGNNNYRGRGGRGRGRGGNNNKQNYYNQGGNNYNNQNQGYTQQTYYTQGQGQGQGQDQAGTDYNYDGEGGDYGYMSKKRRIIDDVYRFLVPTRTVRVIIGKGGETIKSIKSIVPDSKISIYAQGTNNSEIPHNASDRVMSVQCPLENLSKILNELVPKMQLFDGGKLDIRLLVPQHSCSAVIGQKGATIKQIKEETNSSFIGVHNDPLPNSEEHVVKVINTDLQGCVEAVVRVCASITETKGKQHVTFYDPQVWQKGSYGDTGSWLETANDYGGGRGRGRGRGGRGRGGYGGGGYGGGDGGNSGYYNQQYSGGYDNQQAENQSYNYDPNTETAADNNKSEGQGQENYVSYPSY